MVDWGCVYHGNKGTKTHFTAQYMPQGMKVEMGLFIPACSVSTCLLHTLYAPGTAKGVGIQEWQDGLSPRDAKIYFSQLWSALGDGRGQTCRDIAFSSQVNPGAQKAWASPARRMGPRCVRHAGKGALSDGEASRAQGCCRLGSSIIHPNVWCICVVESSLCIVFQGMNLIRACLFLKPALGKSQDKLLILSDS